MNTIEKAKHKVLTIMRPNYLTSIEYICGSCGDFITIEKKSPVHYEISQNFTFLTNIKVELEETA